MRYNIQIATDMQAFRDKKEAIMFMALEALESIEVSYNQYNSFKSRASVQPSKNPSWGFIYASINIAL